jgi:5-hydroxyisourate hydrolase-like protein (transthyretin family)
MKKIILSLLLMSGLLVFARVEAAACDCVREKLKVRDFSGQVLTQTGPEKKEPLAKATVRLLKRVNNETKVIAETLTNEAGYFAVSDIEPGEYILETEAPDFQKVSAEIKIVKSASRKKELEIGLEVGATCCAGYSSIKKK